jgi:hypothetical protein
VRNTCRLLAGKLEGKRPLGRARRKWVYNIKIDNGEREGVLWTLLVWLRVGTDGGLL